VAAVHATASGEPRPNCTCRGGGTVHLQHMGSNPSRAAVDSAARAVTRRTGKVAGCCAAIVADRDGGRVGDLRFCVPECAGNFLND